MGGKHGKEARRPSWKKNLSSSCGDGGVLVRRCGVQWQRTELGQAPGSRCGLLPHPILKSPQHRPCTVGLAAIPPKGNLVGKEFGLEPARSARSLR